MAEIMHEGVCTGAKTRRRAAAAVRSGAFAAAGMEISAALCVLLALWAVFAFTGLWPTGENPYRSYTLQACAWLEGRLHLGQDYPWLELAIYEGKYYVSFPPFPSVVLLPFAAVFGVDTPDHFISLAVTLLGVVYAVRLCRAMGERSARWALCLYLCNGYLFIAAQGWVWFLAQTMCFTLSLMALERALAGRGYAALFAWACAVGCRPMAAFYLPLLLVLLLRRWRAAHPEAGGRAAAARCAAWAVPAGVMAALYMALNAARFGNPFEFGHTYLPEFMRSEAGQFSLGYVAKNLSDLLRLPQPGGENGALRFYTYDCMAFWLISPLLVVFALAWGDALLRRRTGHMAEIVLLPLLAGVHLLLVLSHRTLGGWQFGNRYLLDMMPWLLYGVLAMKPQGEGFERLSAPLMALGFAVNLVGTVAAYNHWI